MKNNQQNYFPKPRSKNQCKKINCIRYASYVKWDCGDSQLNFCMNCKNSHVSQFKVKPSNPQTKKNNDTKHQHHAKPQIDRGDATR